MLSLLGQLHKNSYKQVFRIIEMILDINYFEIIRLQTKVFDYIIMLFYFYITF